MLAYEKHGEIFTYSVPTGVTRQIVKGHFPTWSPDNWHLAFVSLQGTASLVTAAGEPSPWPLYLHHPLTPIRWSPDGEFVSFVDSPGMSIWTTGVLTVSRVKDGESMKIRSFGPESSDFALFQWITGYKDFCNRCEQIKANQYLQTDVAR